MNRDDIIQMAREAGGGPTPPDFLIPVFERFAALVASAEREACAKVCEDSWMAFSRTPNRRLDITPFPELEYVAAAIRARGQA